VIRELAENANAHQPLGPEDERVVESRFVIWLGAGMDDPHWTVVQRLRLESEGLEDVVSEIRALVRSRRRSSCTWEIADSATPPDLVERLLALGCERDREPVAIGMVLDHEPDWPSSGGVVARRVETLDEYRQAIRIGHDAFGMPDDATEERLAHAADDFARIGADTAVYVAFVDGEPVASATAAFTPYGALLFGGATRVAARGRGAYRALVRARWQDAVARETPVLVTHAGAMSKPILTRLGFRAVSRIEILVDELGGD
jgi:hypothetical protein